MTTAERQLVFDRLEAATCRISGLSDAELHRHVQSVYVAVMEGKRRGPLFSREPLRSVSVDAP